MIDAIATTSMVLTVLKLKYLLLQLVIECMLLDLFRWIVVHRTHSQDSISSLRRKGIAHDPENNLIYRSI